MYIINKTASPEIEITTKKIKEERLSLSAVLDLINAGGKFTFPNITHEKLDLFFSGLSSGCVVYFDETTSVQHIVRYCSKLTHAVTCFLGISQPGDTNETVVARGTDLFSYDKDNEAITLIKPSLRTIAWVASQISEIKSKLFFDEATLWEPILEATKVLGVGGILEFSANHPIDHLVKVAMLLKPGSLLKLRGKTNDEQFIQMIAGMLTPFSGLILDTRMPEASILAAASALPPNTMLELGQFCDALIVQKVMKTLRKDCIFRLSEGIYRQHWNAALNLCSAKVRVLVWTTKHYQEARDHSEFQRDKGGSVVLLCRRFSDTQKEIMENVKAQLLDFESLRHPSASVPALLDASSDMQESRKRKSKVSSTLTNVDGESLSSESLFSKLAAVSERLDRPLPSLVSISKASAKSGLVVHEDMMSWDDEDSGKAEPVSKGKERLIEVEEDMDIEEEDGAALGDFYCSRPSFSRDLESAASSIVDFELGEYMDEEGLDVNDIISSATSPFRWANPKPRTFHRRPVAGVAPKYGYGTIPDLPQKSYLEGAAAAANPSVLEHNLVLKQLHCLESSSRITGEVSLSQDPCLVLKQSEEDIAGLAIELSFYTKNQDLQEKQNPMFIFAGRGLNAYVPQCEEGSSMRVILVITREEYATLHGVVELGLDLLVLDKLESPTHGRYENLGLINSRRIAAFIFSLFLHRDFGFSHALMADDNIEQLHFKSEEQFPATWEAAFSYIAAQINKQKTLCGSLSTRQMHKVKNPSRSELGSKLFLFDLQGLDALLGENLNAGFMPFFPASANAYWGEDYYFQIFFDQLCQGRYLGYKILSPTELAITRSKTHRNVFLAGVVVRPIDAICGIDVDIFGESGLSILSNEAHETFFEYIKNTHTQLITVVKNYIQRRLKSQTILEGVSLLEEHAWANGIPFIEPTKIDSITDQAFFTKFSQELTALIHSANEDSSFATIFRPYQVRLLSEINTLISQERAVGRCCEGVIDMATGTGKTYVQIYLAICALLTGSQRPVIIVTPYMSLVKQAYEDFIGLVQKLPESLKSRINLAQIVKVDSALTSVSADVLLHNQSLKNQPVVLIICQASFERLFKSQDRRAEHYKNPCMLLVDESHLIRSFIQEIYKNMNNSFIAELSATPPKRAYAGDEFKIGYSRKKAVEEEQLAPCVLRKFACNWSLDHVKEFIGKAGHFMQNHRLPNGMLLKERKGIFYVPNTAKGYNYSAELKEKLAKENIPSFEINSDDPDSEDNLRAYKNYHRCDHPTKILICKGMGRVGFSDNETYWVIYLQKGKAKQLCQVAGRAVRLNPQDPQKVAYVLAFFDVKLKLLFDSAPHYDPAVLSCLPHYAYQQFISDEELRFEDEQSSDSELFLDEALLLDEEQSFDYELSLEESSRGPKRTKMASMPPECLLPFSPASPTCFADGMASMSPESLLLSLLAHSPTPPAYFANTGFKFFKSRSPSPALTLGTRERGDIRGGEQEHPDSLSDFYTDVESGSALMLQDEGNLDSENDSASVNSVRLDVMFGGYASLS